VRGQASVTIKKTANIICLRCGIQLTEHFNPARVVLNLKQDMINAPARP
jgi:hypothetical protein